jgi:hypothetical protein
MIPLDQIYLFNTVDKSPYVFNFDANVFDVLTPSTTKDLGISFLECFSGSMESVVKPDFEQQQPFAVVFGTAGAKTLPGTALYDYSFSITMENPTKEFTRVFADYVTYFASSNWQIIYKSKGRWFICYAEFQLVNTQVTSDVIQPMIFESKNAKEQIYTIDNFVVS